MIEKNKYYNFSNFFFHVKEINYQPTTGSALVEIYDWAGDDGYSGNKYDLNNSNRMIEMNILYIKSCSEISKFAFQTEIITQMNKSLDQLQRSPFGIVTTYFKKTPKREEILRKRYGTKSTTLQNLP